MLAPLLSEEDRETSLEGAIDPLGLYAIADSLAVRLIPGVRQRQSRARFLTAIAVSTAVCSDRLPDEVAADQVSEPWQVFEWYIVEGLVRGAHEDTDLRGLPGIDKTRQAIRDHVPLSASRYLKTPSVFGFHGVYRQLARSLDIEMAGTLGDTGIELLEAWSEEQGLVGFHGSVAGPGRDWRNRLSSALADGIEAGSVARKPGWSGWQFIAKHLAPSEAGQREAEVILRALERETEPLRRQVFRELLSADGAKTWLASRSERDFHSFMVYKANGSLQEILQAILIYETWSRLLEDAFHDCIYRMSRERAKTSVTSLAKMPLVKKAWQQIPGLYSQVMERLEPFGEVPRFQTSFQTLGDPLPLQDWVNRLIEHHRQVQRRKPPNGKNPWFERFDDGSTIIRPGYLREEGGRGDDWYVHGFRTGPLWSFACDLGAVS